MSKTLQRTNTADFAFKTGDRVFVRTAATLDTTATGTIFAISKGWYVVTLDDTNSSEVLAATKGKVSARISSLELMGTATTHGASLQQEGEAKEQGKPAAAATKPAKAKAKQTPKLPPCCPECESEELESEELANGLVRVTCPDCDWTSDEGEADEEGSVEDALDEAEEHASKMAEALRRARVRYVKDRRPDGAATAHCNDLIARELRDYDPEDVCKLCDRVFALPIGTTLARYDGLNNGQKRMNAGNRIRGAWRKQEDQEVCDRIISLLGLQDELEEPEELEELASIEDRGPEGMDDLQTTDTNA